MNEVVLPGDVFGGLVVHAVLDVFHGEEVILSGGKQDGWKAKQSRNSIRRRYGGECKLNSSTKRSRAKEPTGRNWALCLGAAKMELPR